MQMFNNRRALTLRCGASLLALTALAFAGGAQAQDAATKAKDDATEVVVVGVRKALQSAQQVKKNADTVVDSITATDIGAFPDKSVAEALQRVPGITVTRFAASDDSSHFSAEPSGVLIRGLTQVRTEFNGRDSFSADGARGLNFADIAPELMSRVDAYKNQTADMIEGGIAGTVDLRTRLPFDSKGQVLSISLKGNYGDISKKSTYDYSGLYSNTWDTSLGRFGFLADYANSHVITATNGVIMGRIATICSAGYADSNGNPIVNADGSIPCTATPYGGSNWQYMPSNVTYSSNSYDRNRHGSALALQWRSNDRSVQATLQYNDSYYQNKWSERTIEPWFDDLWAKPAFNPVTSSRTAEAASGTPDLVFGADGMLQSGQIAQHSDYWGAGTDPTNPDNNMNHASIAPGVPFMAGCYDWSTGCSPTQMGERLDTTGRIFDRREGTQDLSFNLKWDVNDRLSTNFDVQYIKASQNSYDIMLSPHTQADIVYSTDGDGVPEASFAPDAGNNYASGFLGNMHNWYYGFVQDHHDHSTANELAVRADAEYRFGGGGWLDSLRVGVRRAERKQQVDYSAFNWAGLYANWGCDAAMFSIDNGPGGYVADGSCPSPTNPNNATFNGYKPGLSELASFGGDFYNGHVLANTPMPFPNVGRLGSEQGLIDELSVSALNNGVVGQGWTPICERATDVSGSCYTQAEMLYVDEVTNAAYLELKFGGSDKTIFGSSVTLSGNVGVRYVQTKDTSDGGIAFPLQDWYNNANAQPCNKPITDPHQVTNISCWLTPELLAYSNSGSALQSYGGEHDNWLPSLNLKFGLTDKQLIRFAASRALSRPDMGQLRNYLSVAAPAIDTSDTSPYIVWNDPNAPHTAANVKGYNFVFTGSSGNPGLQPITADQFDLSYENYFAPSGSFTFDLFYKRFNSSLGLGKYARDLSNNGVTETVIVTAGANTNDGGNLRGFEAAYQQFFDFLPGLWSGLGVQANYTHVSQNGINNTNLANFPGYDSGSTIAYGGGVDYGTAVIDSHRLAGISDDTYNLVALYEKGPVAARLAYNYRSKYLVNNLDAIIGLPVFEKGAGYLDASIRYQINDHVEISLEGTNLTGTTAVLQQQIFGDTSVTPGAKPVFKDSSWIKNDRRYQLGVRFKY